MMSPHHGADMRATLDIPKDLHRIATSLARDTRRSLSQVVAELMRRGLEASAAVYRLNADTGLPVIVGATRPMTGADVRGLDDEA